MTNSTTDIPMLDDDAVAEIEARPVVDTAKLDVRRIRVLLTPEERDALCQTVRVLRAENERLRERNKSINRQLVSLKGGCR